MAKTHSLRSEFEGGNASLMQHVETTYAAVGSWIHVGEFLMPSGWVARWDDPDYPYTAELRIVLVDGGDYRPVCAEITTRQRDGGQPISGDSLRVPVERIIRNTAANVALRATDGDAGAWKPVGDDDIDALYRRLARPKDEVSRRRSDDPETLRDVASIYVAALPTRTPVQAVAAAFTVSQRQADRLVQSARDSLDPDTGDPFLSQRMRPGKKVPLDLQAQASSMLDESEEEGDTG